MRRQLIVMFRRYAAAPRLGPPCLGLWGAICLAMLLIAPLSESVGADMEAYRVQPGDVLVVSVWKETDLQSEVLVRPDGGMSFPLVGDVQASGRTVDELRSVVDGRLRKFIPDATVTIAVKQIGGNRVYVLGKVNRPGEFAFSQPIDVMQVLSLAGGATSFASLDDIRILRREQGRQSALRFRYSEVEKGRALDQNILLKSGDTVVVP